MATWTVALIGTTLVATVAWMLWTSARRHWNQDHEDDRRRDHAMVGEARPDQAAAGQNDARPEEAARNGRET